jgi:uncharacterized membrane protein
VLRKDLLPHDSVSNEPDRPSAAPRDVLARRYPGTEVAPHSIGNRSGKESAMTKKTLLGIAAGFFGLLFGMLLGWAVPAAALDAVPLYEPLPIGEMIRDANPTAGISTAAAVNRQGDVVGRVVIDGVYEAFVFTEMHGVQFLPPLPGWSSHVAVDLTDRNASTGSVLIVGSAQTLYGDPDRAVVWEYDPSAGAVLDTVDIGLPTGADWSTATAVNGRGLVVGYARAVGWMTPYQPFVYDFGSRTLHALDVPFNPVDINEVDVITGGTYRAQLVETPSGFEAPSPENLATSERPSVSRTTALNDAGQVVGVTSMGYTDGAGRMVAGAVRHTDGVGWEVLWANSAYDTANDVNLHGDVVGSIGASAAIRPFLYIDALQQGFRINDLVDPALPPAYADYGANAINEAGWIAAGASGAVLFKRVGDMPPPTPPGSVTAVTHEPTWQQPWNAITVAWEGTSAFTKTYSVERSPSGANAWQAVMTERNVLQFHDTTGELGQLYDYRVIANGLAGPSVPSEIASAQFPSDPLDVTPPVVSIVRPADGEEVSGNVTVVADFADVGGLEYAEISVSPDNGRPIVCSESLAGATAHTLSCTWRTKRIPLGSYVLSAYAFDTLGNWARQSVTVTLVEGDGGGGGGKGGGKGKGKP